METYRLKSKIVENDKEFVIQTSNDVNLGTISSTVYVDQEVAEEVDYPYPQGMGPEEVLSLVKATHGDKKKELETLMQTYRKVISGSDSNMMYHLGTAFYYKRFYHEARELFQAAVTLNPEHHQAYNYLGMTHLTLGMAAEAVEFCTKAVQMRPGYADYRNNLGEALLANRSCRPAIKEFEEAIRINLYYSDAYLNLGLAHLLNRLVGSDSASSSCVVSSATDCFKKASLIYPDYNAINFEEGLQTLQGSDLKRAFSLFEKVRDTKKEKHRREFAAFYLKFALHPDWVSEEVINDRIRFLQAEIGKNPTYVDLYTELGRCLLERAKLSWQGGIEQYKKAVAINPSLAGVHQCLDAAEKEYDNVCQVLSKIVDKS